MRTVDLVYIYICVFVYSFIAASHFLDDAFGMLSLVLERRGVKFLFGDVQRGISKWDFVIYVQYIKLLLKHITSHQHEF